MHLTCQTPFDVLHPEHAAAPQWRRCNISIEKAENGILYYNVAVRRKAGGSDIGDLFDSWGFRAGLDRILEDILRQIIPDAFSKDRRFPLMYSGSRGASDNGQSSPNLSFPLPEDIAASLSVASAHRIIAFGTASLKIAEREAKRRKNFSQV
jgi:hypothetical protein